MPISGGATRPAGWRPLEVTVVVASEILPWRYPPRTDLQYGEWLRDGYERGELEPPPFTSPDLAVAVATVRAASRPLVGPPAVELLDLVPRDDLVRAIRREVPSLLADLDGDTRNVLLTLARAWLTVTTGEIVPKDVAADWASTRLASDLRAPLERARDLYRSGGFGEWPDAASVRATADALVRHVTSDSHPT